MLIGDMKAHRKALSGRVEPEILPCERFAVWSKNVIWWLLGTPVKSVLNPSTSELSASVKLTHRSTPDGVLCNQTI